MNDPAVLPLVLSSDQVSGPLYTANIPSPQESKFNEGGIIEDWGPDGKNYINTGLNQGLIEKELERNRCKVRGQSFDKYYTELLGQSNATIELNERWYSNPQEWNPEIPAGANKQEFWDNLQLR